MSLVIRVHYDGKTIVPDEPVDLPINQPMEAELRVPEAKLTPAEIKRRRAAMKRFASRAVKGANIPLEALRRENMYEPPRGL
ncbi:MAG: hypothetical protein Q7T82_19880 [Armatimonadota bacterium]|nr:hypothetical protein [Armatimonadota bacterium]